MYGGDLELDTIYYYEATMTGHELEEDPETGELAPTGPEVTSEVKETDRFLLYEVQVTDLLSRIAKHYGVSMEQIRRDNELSEQLTQEGTVLFIRNPETDEPYTYQIPEDQLEQAFVMGINKFNVGTEFFLLDTKLSKEAYSSDELEKNPFGAVTSIRKGLTDYIAQKLQLCRMTV